MTDSVVMARRIIFNRAPEAYRINASDIMRQLQPKLFNHPVLRLRRPPGSPIFAYIPGTLTITSSELHVSLLAGL